MIKPSKNQSLLFYALSSLLLGILFWMTLAPAQLGGWVTYVIVNGNSMEPGFYRGDLVLVRSQPKYDLGDAVVYFDPNLGSYVFHRIVQTELDRFILQGDNNAWLDSYQPTQKEVIGKLWIHIPKLGKAIEWMRVPMNMSLTIGLMGVALMLDLLKTPSQHKKEKTVPAFGFSEVPQVGLSLSVFFTLLFLISGIYSFTRPLNRPAENISYQQEGNFYYSATGTPGVYDTDVVRSGEPVFPKLTCYLNIGFTYNILGDRFQTINGKQTMYARILDEQSGWQRTIPLTPENSFSGNSYFSTATLDLCQVESIVNLVEQEAGLKQIAYTLEIISDASFTANAAGILINDSFSPKLVFKYDKIHFYLADDGKKANPLYSTMSGMAGSYGSEKNTLSLLGMQIPVWLIRFLSLLGFGVSTIILTSTALTLYRTTSQNQQALILLKYGGMLVDVYEQDLATTFSTIDVRSIDDLARLAERHGTMILHMAHNATDYYFVQSNNTTYRYIINPDKYEIQQTQFTPEFSKPLVPVKTEPIPMPEPVQSQPIETPPQPKPRIIYTYAPQAEVTQPVITRITERKVASPKPSPQEVTEYIIHTGRIEFDLNQETILPRIKI